LAAFTELLSEGIRFLRTIARSRTVLGAEVLFLRKQLAYNQEREIRPRRLTDAARLVSGVLVSVLRLERVAGHCDPGNVPSLASQGLAVLLAVEIAWWSTGGTEGDPPAHRSHGEGKHHLGEKSASRMNCP
jgi:hypothetical protein